MYLWEALWSAFRTRLKMWLPWFLMKTRIFLPKYCQHRRFQYRKLVWWKFITYLATIWSMNHKCDGVIYQQFRANFKGEFLCQLVDYYSLMFWYSSFQEFLWENYSWWSENTSVICLIKRIAWILRIDSRKSLDSNWIYRIATVWSNLCKELTVSCDWNCFLWAASWSFYMRINVPKFNKSLTILPDLKRKFYLSWKQYPWLILWFAWKAWA